MPTEVIFCDLCKNNSLNSSLHQMPKNEIQRKKWVDALGLNPKLNYPPNYKICDDHFFKKDLSLNKKKSLALGRNYYGLKKNSIPKKRNLSSMPSSSSTNETIQNYPQVDLIESDNLDLIYESDESKSQQSNGSVYSPDATDEDSGTDDDEDFYDDISSKTHRSYFDPTAVLDDVLFFVFISQIMKLFKFCHHDGCKANIVGQPNYYYRGFMVVIETRCEKNHIYSWNSMPSLPGISIPIGNVLIPSALAMDGNGWVNLQSLKRLLNFVMPTESTFLRLLKRFFYPIVKIVFNSHINGIKDDLAPDMDKLAFATDGAIDNPGRGSGSLCTTCAMDVGRVTYNDDGYPNGSTPGTNLIFSFQLTHVAETKNKAAAQMEPLGFERLLEDLRNDERTKNWAVVVTDAHVSIPNIVKKFQPGYNPEIVTQTNKKPPNKLLKDVLKGLKLSYIII